MRTVSLVVFACACAGQGGTRSLPAYPGTAERGAVVWSGFTQEWGYNHRLNSMGDWVGPVTCDDAGCDVEIGHSAASGTGADVADWTSGGTRVYSEDAWFYQGITELSVAGDRSEGLSFATAAVAEVTLPEEMVGLERYEAFLAGFDLYSTGDPDRLEDLGVAVGRAEVDEAGGLRLPLDTFLRTDCDSLECDGAVKLDTSVDYVLRVAWLLVGGAADRIAVRDVAIEAAYAWEDGRGTELSRASVARRETVEADPELGAPIAALRGIVLAMANDHHMAEWESSVRLDGEQGADGRVTVVSTTMFKQWNPGTVDFALSYTEAGSATTRADVALLQIAGARQADGDVTGRITWNADGGPANSDAAVQTVTERFEREAG